jgi:hypothetical protein
VPLTSNDRWQLTSSLGSADKRLAELAVDGWELESGEARQSENPEKFWIPERALRDSLRVGQLVQLLFQIQGQDDDGNAEVNVERMWVEVDGRIGGLYVGTLRNQPATIEAGQGLDFKSRVAFRSEHIIDIRDGYEPSGRQPTRA